MQSHVKTPEDNKAKRSVVLTQQIHADLRVAWNLLEGAGHKAAADRIFALIDQPTDRQMSDAGNNGIHHHGIAEQVFHDYQVNGRIAVPAGKKAVALSTPMSADADDKHTVLHLIFEDGSELAVYAVRRVDIYSVVYSPPGESEYAL